ncbi:50S ribosomal protein L18 [Emticicia sp. 17c]|uniref:50S ribosomal protein L18 n=1 Tax=Emticicia sp. 17c TaxID=3127704 RepID=UPI00301CE7EE
MSSVKTDRRQKIKWSIRSKVSGTPERPRLTVFRSNTAIYAQLIDDTQGVTLAAASTSTLGLKGVKVDNSKEVGKKLAEIATEKGIGSCVFDRNGYLYHGNIKALADGAREGGLKF